MNGAFTQLKKKSEPVINHLRYSIQKNKSIQVSAMLYYKSFYKR